MDNGLHRLGNSPGGDPGTRAVPVHDFASLHIPDHHLVRRIGAGSYGEVWLAKNMLGVYRAAKVVFRDSFETERPFERELSGIRKFEPISRSYDGFIDILHVGSNEDQSCFFYVMELGDDQVSGQSIDPTHYEPKTLASEIARRRPLPLHEVLQLGISLSHTLAELHRQGLVHRDVKPSNIIFVNGAPKLADIGLVAKANATFSFVGTAGYIPPEGPGTVQADIYSLGKVLYEASTGNDRQDFPSLPTIWTTSPEHDALLELNEIIIRACDNDPRKRYASASDMQADLALLVGGKSVRRLRTLEQRWHNIKRGARITAILVVMLGLLSLVIYTRWRTAINAYQQQIGGNVAYGNAALESGDFLAALPYYAEVLRLDKSQIEAQTSERLRFGSVLAQCPKLTHLWFEEKGITDGQFSPDGKHLLIAEDLGKCRIYDFETGQCSAPFGPRELLSSASYSPDGRFVVTASQDWTASVWDCSTLAEIHRLGHSNRVYNARFSPTGGEVITSCKDGIARVWDLTAGEPRLMLRGHTAPVNFAAFSRDGRLIATGGQDGTARLWRASDGAPVGKPIKHGRWVTCVCFSPDNQKLVTTADDHRACVWEVATGTQVMPDLMHGDMVKSAEFSPDGRLILTASLDGTARFWRTDKLRPLDTNPVLKHAKRVTQASFSLDGHSVLTCGVDGCVKIWDFAGGSVLPNPLRYSFNEDATRVVRVNPNGSFLIGDALSSKPVSPEIQFAGLPGVPELSPEGRFAFIVCRDVRPAATNSVLRIWNAMTGDAVSPPISFPHLFTTARLSRDGKHLVAYGAKIAQIWDIHSRMPSSQPLSYEWPIRSVLFDAPGKRAVIVSGNKAYVLNTDNGEALFTPLTHPVSVEHAEFSPDNRLLVTCCADDQYTECFAQVWDAQSGQPTGPQLRHSDGVLWASFSPDGSKVLTAGEDFMAKLWETATGKPIGRPLKHEGRVITARFGPDGNWIVTASADKTARVWWATTQDPLAPPLRHLAPCLNAQFLPDGQHVLTTDSNGQNRVWSLSIDKRPVGDLVSLAHLLNNDLAPTVSGSEVALQPLLQQLRARYPQDFEVSKEQIAAWHDFEAQQSELEEQWAAAVFHLQRLQKLRPDDRGLAERITKLRQKAEKAE